MTLIWDLLLVRCSGGLLKGLAKVLVILRNTNLPNSPPKNKSQTCRGTGQLRLGVQEALKSFTRSWMFFLTQFHLHREFFIKHNVSCSCFVQHCPPKPLLCDLCANTLKDAHTNVFCEIPPAELPLLRQIRSFGASLKPLVLQGDCAEALVYPDLSFLESK